MGFWFQRIENIGPPFGYCVEAGRWWAWFLGLRPGRGKRVNLGGAFLQIWALMGLVIGLLAALVWDTKALTFIILAFWILGYLLFALAGALIVLIEKFRNRRR